MLPNRFIQIIHSYVPIGMMLWLLSWFIPLFDQTERIILFAAFVVVPLLLFRIFESAIKKPVLFIKIFIFLIPIGAFALAWSFSLSPGGVAGLLSIPWGLTTFTIAALGIVLLARSETFGDVSKAIGFLYISVGGIWLVAHQFDLPLLGFEGQIMLLTVNHFHYAGFVAPVLFGFLYDSGHNKVLSKFVVVLGGIAPILIAVGMTYSSIVEWLSIIVFASSLLLYSVLVFIYVIPNSKRWTKVFHIVSSGAIWITMALALTFGYGLWVGQPTIPISTMILFHGWGNAVLFSFIGILAWHATLMDHASSRIPLCLIQGKGKIGANIFADLGVVVDHTSGEQPTGLIDDVKNYRSEHFNPKLFYPDLIDFYEHTDDYELLLKAHWSPVFKLPARIYKILSNWLEQMNFPLKEETNEQLVESKILPIQDEKDGRNKVRAWVRTYTHTNKAIYAALYSSHVSDGMRYMNIAFPLPYSQMTSVLKLQHGSDDTLVLTSWSNSNDAGPGDQGVYVAFNGQAIRMPINETITVWKELDSPPGRIEAKHDMWLFGMKFLTLDYHIFKGNK